jgi:SAM-dependent methyltransferase
MRQATQESSGEEKTFDENILSQEGHAGPCLARVKDHTIIACAACGFRHALPLPDPAAMERAYRENYYAEEKPTFLAHAGEDQAWAELAQQDRLEIFERLLGSGRRRLLDIGSGPGFFLATAKARGWQASGIEPSRQAAAHARQLGVDVVEGFFNAASARTLGRFDAIHLNNVLEHIPDPIALLTLAGALLEPGGLICINVPNDFSPLQIAGRAAVNAEEWWIAPPHHLNYFDFESLTRLLTRLGFTPRERLTSFPMELFLMMGEDYTKNPALGRACHNRRKAFDMAFEAAGLKETRRAFYRALAEAGLGREAVVIATKP